MILPGALSYPTTRLVIMEYNSFLYKLLQILTIASGFYTVSLLGKFLFGINAPLTLIVIFTLLLGFAIFTRFYWLMTANNKAHVFLTIFASSLTSTLAVFLG